MRGRQEPGKRKEWVQEKIPEVERLAQIGCTYHEIAYIMDTSVGTIQKYFADVINKGKANLCGNIRREQVRKALTEKNTQMLIWLGKQYLNQREPRTEQETQGAVTVKAVYYADGDEDSGFQSETLPVGAAESTR